MWDDGGGYYLRRQRLRVMDGVALLGCCAPLSRRRHSCTSVAFLGEALMRWVGLAPPLGTPRDLVPSTCIVKGQKGSPGSKCGNSTAQCCGTTPRVCRSASSH